MFNHAEPIEYKQEKAKMSQSGELIRGENG